ncbi:MAG: DUF2236 domain-containing protein [Chloroflexi bacterium]|nr:DUF2236 domain-containing protein [Chloroflexota bacterium]
MTNPKLRTLQEYRAYLHDEISTIDNPEAGFFGPGSMAWRLNREVVLALVVLRALLMQVAHPKVAQAIADHSDFRRRPYSRALATLRAQQTIVFGTCDQAAQALIRIYSRHTQVVGEGEVGYYEANDPELLFWVYATLIDSMLYAYRTFLPNLTISEWTVFYEEGKYFAQLIGIPSELVPLDLAAFEGWMANQLSGTEIHVTKDAVEIAHSLLGLPLRLAWPLTSLLAAGSLPKELRAGFGLPWTAMRGRIYASVAALLRAAFRWLPGFLHIPPVYYMALWRVGRSK